MAEALTSFIGNAGALAPLYYIMGFVVSAVLPFIPTPLIGALGGTAFGFAPAVAYGFFGLALGAFTALGLARLIGRPLVYRVMRPKAWKRWEELLGIKSVFVWGLVFFILNIDFSYLAAGLTSLSLRQLLLAAIVARLPWLIASAWFGETFLKSDALLLPIAIVLLVLLVVLGRLRPRIQHWLATIGKPKES